MASRVGSVQSVRMAACQAMRPLTWRVFATLVADTPRAAVAAHQISSAVTVELTVPLAFVTLMVVRAAIVDLIVV